MSSTPEAAQSKKRTYSERLPEVTPPKSSTSSFFRAKSSIPQEISWEEFARQCTLAAVSSRLNPFALHPAEYRLLRETITRPQVTIYLNIRNAILRIWHRNPLITVTKEEAAGCARDNRYFPLSQFAYQWLVRNGYINFGCVDVPNTAGSIPRSKAKGGRRKTIVVIGAGVSGLGCARQLQGLFSQIGDSFTSEGERPPKVVVLEGRCRIGGRVYSHPLKKQAVDTLPSGLRSTVEMGAHIVTGFEHGNPMNAIIRGQLGLRYHRLRDNSVLYDHDGREVDKQRDMLVEKLYNDILERASVFRNKVTKPRTMEGNREMIEQGREPIYDDGEVISVLEASDSNVSVTNPQKPAAKSNGRNHAPVSTEKLTGRAYNLQGWSAKTPAATAARNMGWDLKPGVSPKQAVSLESISKASDYPTLLDAMEEGLD
ncbi:hypothetical protein LTS18_013296, partial [Coniosporium uncinatum]